MVYPNLTPVRNVAIHAPPLQIAHQENGAGACLKTTAAQFPRELTKIIRCKALFLLDADQARLVLEHSVELLALGNVKLEAAILFIQTTVTILTLPSKRSKKKHCGAVH